MIGFVLSWLLTKVGRECYWLNMAAPNCNVWPDRSDQSCILRLKLSPDQKTVFTLFQKALLSLPIRRDSKRHNGHSRSPVASGSCLTDVCTQVACKWAVRSDHQTRCEVYGGYRCKKKTRRQKWILLEIKTQYVGWDLYDSRIDIIIP